MSEQYQENRPLDLPEGSRIGPDGKWWYLGSDGQMWPWSGAEDTATLYAPSQHKGDFHLQASGDIAHMFAQRLTGHNRGESRMPLDSTDTYILNPNIQEVDTHTTDAYTLNPAPQEVDAHTSVSQETDASSRPNFGRRHPVFLTALGVIAIGGTIFGGGPILHEYDISADVHTTCHYDPTCIVPRYFNENVANVFNYLGPTRRP